MSARIASLEVIAYRLPLRGELQWGKHGRLSTAESCLVRVTLTDGSTGVAEAPPRPTIYGETTASITGIIGHLEPRLRDLEIIDTDGIKDALASVANNHCAKGALDMALWAARAASSETDLHALIGGTKTRLETSFILGIGTMEAMLTEARRIVAAGVRVLKVKVGRDTAHDVEVIRALRAEFGDAVKLYADSNETLEPGDAPRALELMRDAGVLWVEEPLPVRRLWERAALKRAQILPIIADDSCFTPADLERELDFDTFDVLNIKTARNGFTDSLAMMATAAAAGKGVMVGSQASTTLGTLHAALVASRAEVTHPSELAFPLKLVSDITTRIPTVADGFFDLEDARSITVDAAKLEAARIAR